jgi:hypothetical protein
MNLYIKIENGQPVDHPAIEENLIHAFRSIPSNFAPFNRVQRPDNLLTSPFQIAQCTYTLMDDGITWQDTWSAIQMTADEQAALIAQTQTNPPCPNITLDTTTLKWNPSTPMPTDGQTYKWNWSTGEWILKS